MSISIKNEETHRLARELAGMTGESMTVAVTVAIRERLERVQHDQDQGQLAEKLIAIGKATAPLLREPYRTGNLDDLLYDESGLPR